MYIEWNEKLITGIENIDAQHKTLVDIINRLYEDIVINKDGNIVNELLMDLKIYTINHFSAEEKLLKKYKYPKEDEHKLTHQVFVNKISEFLYDISSERLEQGKKIIKFLKIWIVAHIMEHDMEYVCFLRKHKDFLADIQDDVS